MASSEPLDDPIPIVVTSAAIVPGFVLKDQTDITKKLGFDISVIATATEKTAYYTNQNSLSTAWYSNNLITGIRSISITGTDNTIYGCDAGSSLTTGSRNLLFGKNAQAGSVDAYNRIVLGYGSTGISDNSLTIGSSITKIYATGLENKSSGYILYFNAGTGQISYYDAPQQEIPAGSEAAPGFVYVSDSDTGFWQSAVNNINISAGGSEIMRLNSQVLSVVGSAAAPTWSFINDVNTGIYNSAADNLDFTTGGTQRINIAQYGIKAITGTEANPSFGFIGSTTGIYNSGGLGISISGVKKAEVTANQLLVSVGSSVSEPDYSFTADPNTGIYNSAADTLDLITGGSVKLSLTTVLTPKVPLVTSLTSLNNTAATLSNSSLLATLIVQNASTGNLASFLSTAAADDTQSGKIYFGRSVAANEVAYLSYYPSATSNRYLSFGVYTTELLKIMTSGSLNALNGSAAEPIYSFANSTGTGSYLPSAGNYGVSISGTQKVNIDANQIVAVNSASAATPTWSFLGDTDTGIYSSTANVLDFSAGSIRSLSVTTQILGINTASAVTPTWSFLGDTDTGIYSSTANTLNVAVGGTNALSVTSALFSLNVPFGVGNGTAGAPSYTFSGDTDTGMYYSGTNTLSFSTGGSQRLIIDASGIVTFTGSTSGNTLADATLPAQIAIANTATGGFAVTKAGVSGAIFGYSYSNVALGSVLGPIIRSIQVGETINFFTDSTTRSLYLSSVGQFNIAGSAANPAITFIGDTDTGIYSNGANVLSFSTGGAELLRLDTQIGSASLGAVSTPAYTFINDANTGIYSSGADTFDIATGGVNRLSISTSAATSTLPILTSAGTVSAPSFSFSADTNTGLYRVGADTVALVCGGAETLTLSTNNVTANKLLFLQDGLVSTPSLAFVSDTSTGIYRSAASTINFATNGTSRLVLNTASLTLTLPILAADGSVSAPSLSFSADTNTGIYRSAADTLDFACNGANIVSLTTTNAKIGSGISLTKNQTIATQTMQNISPSTSVTITSSAQDFPYIIQPQIEVYVNNANSTAGYTGATPALLGSPLMIFTSAPSNGAGLSNALSLISFPKGIYRITYSILFNNNTAIIDFSAAHSGGGAVLQRSIDSYSGRATTTNLTADFEDIIVTTATGTITLSWIANGKNASSTNYYVAVGSFRVYRLASY